MTEQAEKDPAFGNVERLNKVADMIQANPEHFDMEWFVTRNGDARRDVRLSLAADARSADLFKCGTTACIAGWACNLWGAEVDDLDEIEDNAARILGLDRKVAGALFVRFDLDTADKAAGHLRRMALAIEDAS